MKKILVLCLLAFLGTTTINAQGYSTAIGIKGGFPGYGGLNLKHDFGGIFGDFTVGASHYSYNVTALLEKQAALKDGFDWYIGAGLYFSNWGKSYYYDGLYYASGNTYGIVGALGLEYTFEALPLNIGADVGPYINLSNYGPYNRIYFGGNLAARFVIK